jgi:hypothetical protein
MILAFDIDTHETVIGLFADGELADHWTISTRTQRSVDELGLLVRTLMRESGFDADEIRAAVIASAAPRMTDAAAEMADRHLGARVLVVDAARQPARAPRVDEPAPSAPTASSTPSPPPGSSARHHRGGPGHRHQLRLHLRRRRIHRRRPSRPA